jgi:hypothetical protein
MKIETKLDIGDKGYFLMHGKVHSSIIVDIEIRVKNDYIIYTVKENPAGSQYTIRFSSADIFGSKEDLLASL